MTGALLRRVYWKVASALGAGPDDSAQGQRCYVYVVALKDGRAQAKTLRRLCPGGYHIQPMIDRAGTRVAFWGRDESEPGYHLWVAPLRGAPAARLTRGASVNGHPFWFPDGQRLAFFSTEGVSNAGEWSPRRQFDPDRPHQNLWTAAADGADRQRLTEGPHVDERPCVSPDGREIVFVSNRGGAMNLWRIGADGTGLRPVTAHGGVDYRPVFAHDGSRLAYFTEDTTSKSHVLAIRPWPEGTAEPVRLARDFAWLHGPFWSSDGETLLVHGVRPGDPGPRLWLIEVASGVARALKVPGLKTCSHGSWDAAQGLLACDSHSLVG